MLDLFERFIVYFVSEWAIWVQRALRLRISRLKRKYYVPVVIIPSIRAETTTQDVNRCIFEPQIKSGGVSSVTSVSKVKTFCPGSLLMMKASTLGISCDVQCEGKAWPTVIAPTFLLSIQSEFNLTVPHPHITRAKRNRSAKSSKRGFSDTLVRKKPIWIISIII